MNRVVRIEHETPYADSLMFLQWALGNVCNFACSYCPTELHDGSVRSLPLEVIERFSDRVIAAYSRPGRALLVEFTGGEATLYPDYPALIRYLDTRGVTLALSTNASRTLHFWEKVAPHLDHVNVTFHSEFTDADHLFEVIRLLRQAGSSVHANVMVLPSQFHRCVAVAERLAATIPDVTIALQGLRYDIGDRSYPYTPQQLEVLATRSLPIQFTEPPRQLSKGRMVQVFEDGRRQTVEGYQLILRKENRFEGWQCRIGLDELVVDYRGNVWAGWCQVGGRIGHVADEHIRFPEAPVRCTKPSCDCTLDVMNRRERVLNLRLAR
jgi:pyruvate-formate lyase-activating enzyme